MSGDLLVGADALAADPPGTTLVLDVTVDLAAPRVDGDYRVASGRRAWEDRRLPGSVHLDLLTEVVDHSRPYHFARPSPAVLIDAFARLCAGGRRIVVSDDGRMQWAARVRVHKSKRDRSRSQTDAEDRPGECSLPPANRPTTDLARGDIGGADLEPSRPTTSDPQREHVPPYLRTSKVIGCSLTDATTGALGSAETDDGGDRVDHGELHASGR